LDPHGGEQRPELPRPTLWPVGFAVGIACILVGLVVSWPAVAVGGGIALLFGFLWARDVMASRARAAHAASVEAERPPLPAQAGGPATAPAPAERFPRSKFLEASTLGLGALIGGAVTVPAIGFALAPPFVRQGRKDIDLGPVTDYPEGKWQIVHFLLSSKDGEVARRTAYIRYNGLVTVGGKSQPSFTIISNRCAHLGCPVQPNGLPQPNQTKDEKTAGGNSITLTPVAALAGFGCPCHGGQYDSEGNRTAGPPVRGLDRYYFSVRNGRLYLGKAYSVKTVVGQGADAKIRAFPLTNPGDHVDDWESWLYPVQAPH
jgi:Rieske Fe-S protein